MDRDDAGRDSTRHASSSKLTLEDLEQVDRDQAQSLQVLQTSHATLMASYRRLLLESRARDEQDEKKRRDEQKSQDRRSKELEQAKTTARQEVDETIASLKSTHAIREKELFNQVQLLQKQALTREQERDEARKERDSTREVSEALRSELDDVKTRYEKDRNDWADFKAWWAGKIKAREEKGKKPKVTEADRVICGRMGMATPERSSSSKGGGQQVPPVTPMVGSTSHRTPANAARTPATIGSKDPVSAAYKTPVATSSKEPAHSKPRATTPAPAITTPAPRRPVSPIEELVTSSKSKPLERRPVEGWLRQVSGEGAAPVEEPQADVTPSRLPLQTTTRKGSNSHSPDRDVRTDGGTSSKGKQTSHLEKQSPLQAKQQLSTAKQSTRQVPDTSIRVAAMSKDKPTAAQQPTSKGKRKAPVDKFTTSPSSSPPRVMIKAESDDEEQHEVALYRSQRSGRPVDIPYDREAVLANRRKELEEIKRNPAAFKGRGRYAVDLQRTHAQYVLDPALNRGELSDYRDVVRDRQTRKQMHAHDCWCCKDYWEAVGNLEIPGQEEPSEEPARKRARQSDAGPSRTDRAESSPPVNDPNTSRGRLQAINAEVSRLQLERERQEDLKLEAMRKSGRHRKWGRMPPRGTPERYWEIGFPSTQAQKEINEIADKQTEDWERWKARDERYRKKD